MNFLISKEREAVSRLDMRPVKITGPTPRKENLATTRACKERSYSAHPLFEASVFQSFNRQKPSRSTEFHSQPVIHFMNARARVTDKNYTRMNGKQERSNRNL